VPGKSAFDDGVNAENEFPEKRSALLKSARIILFGVASLVFNLSLSSLSFSSPKAQFSIVYSNDVMGEIEPCG
jgi:hypothetical protein